MICWWFLPSWAASSLTLWHPSTGQQWLAMTLPIHKTMLTLYNLSIIIARPLMNWTYSLWLSQNQLLRRQLRNIPWMSRFLRALLPIKRLRLAHYKDRDVLLSPSWKRDPLMARTSVLEFLSDHFHLKSPIRHDRLFLNLMAIPFRPSCK